jgi:hypothetical protein
MSVQRLKSPHSGLLSDDKNGMCGIAKYGAEFPSIGNHSPKCMRTEGGLTPEICDIQTFDNFRGIPKKLHYELLCATPSDWGNPTEICVSL